MLNYNNIVFQDNLKVPTMQNMNCIQFCVVYLADKFCIPLSKFNWHHFEYPRNWFYGDTNFIFHSLLQFFRDNQDLVCIKKIILNGNCDNDTILIYRYPNMKWLHHAGMYNHGDILHCLPPRGIRITPFSKNLFLKGCVGLWVKPSTR